MSPTLEYATETCWVEICKKVNGALVFLDDCSSECLHWHGGIQRLLKAGAVGAKPFSSFEGGNDGDKKAVFLVTSPLIGPARMILRDIISNSAFEHSILISACSPLVLNLATADNPPENSPEQSPLHKLERDILHWMKKPEYTVEIFHFPYGCIPLNDYLFIYPVFNDYFPCFEEDFKSTTEHSSKLLDWEMESLPLEAQIGISYLMTALNNLLSQLNVREDIYCLGPFSNLVGSLLQKNSTSHLRSKTTTSSMSLLLIDRTLDMCTPVSFNSECLFDLMKNVLPAFPGQTVDVAINMESLFSKSNDCLEEFIYPGCLHEPKGHTFEWLLHKSCPEVLKGISKEVCSILNEREKILSPSDLEDTITNKFTLNYDSMLQHSSLLQAAFGIVQTLRSSKLEKTKLIKSFHMVLLQLLSSDVNTDAAVTQMVDLINSRKSDGFELDHLFYILIYFYSFIGDKYTISPDLEMTLMSTLSKAITEDKDKYSGNVNLNFDTVSNIDEFCGIVFKKLNSLKTSRKHLFKYRDVSSYQDSMMPLEYNGVLLQLLKDILDPMKIGIPDLRHKPNMSLRNNLASRFSMLLNTNRAHITDSDSLLIFFIGGVTGEEVKLIKSFFKHYQKPVIIGSTSFLSPADVTRKLFVRNPLKPFVM